MHGLSLERYCTVRVLATAGNSLPLRTVRSLEEFSKLVLVRNSRLVSKHCSRNSKWPSYYSRRLNSVFIAYGINYTYWFTAVVRAGVLPLLIMPFLINQLQN
jgi:hypothetical protein